MNEEMLKETGLNTETMYKGKTFDVQVSDIQKGDGSRSKREVVQRCAAAAVVAINDRHEVYVVKQFRFALNRVVTEIPAGKIDKDEEPRDAALRELREETGMVPDDIQFLGEIAPSPGYTSELIYLYLATGLHNKGQKLDPGENLIVETMPFDKLMMQCAEGYVDDSKTGRCCMEGISLAPHQ